MTLSEARTAAHKREKIVHNGITYDRIEFVGYKYREDGLEIPSVRLIDKCGHSITDADPYFCERAEIAAITNAAEDERRER